VQDFHDFVSYMIYSDIFASHSMHDRFVLNPHYHKIPRKGGPGITRSDLLVINKVDLAPFVGASLAVMERDARLQRGTRPFIFTNLKNDTGLDEVIVWLEQQIKIPAEQRHPIIDAHAAYIGQPHNHDHDHSHSRQGPDPLKGMGLQSSARRVIAGFT
jgi:hypothetical protein